MWKKVLCCLLAPFAAAASDLLWQADFSSPAMQEMVRKCPGASIIQDFEHNHILRIKVSPGETGRHFVEIPLDFQKWKMDGLQVEIQGEVKMTHVARHPKSKWEGVQFRLLFPYEGAVHDPRILYGNKVPYFGTTEWFLAGNKIHLFHGVTKGKLSLGLNNVSGEIQFRNIRILKAGKALVSTLKQNPVPQARYTREFPVRRGVMSPFVPREEDFAELRRWGANLIRWQLNVGTRRNVAECVTLLDRYLDQVEKALALSEKYGIKLVIDLHAGGGLPLLMGTKEGRDAVIAFWRKTVKRFQGHPALWGYDILNEPHSRVLSPGDPSYPEFAGKIIQTIRELDPETPIIVEPEGLGGEEMLEYLPIYPYPNIFYSVHIYFPGEITHQLDRTKKQYLSYPGGKFNKQALRERLERKVRPFQVKTGAKIFVGEFGCVRWAPGADELLRDMISLFEEYGWTWCFHAFRESDVWSVEHNEDPMDRERKTGMTKRKRVLLDAFQKNRTEKRISTEKGK